MNYSSKLICPYASEYYMVFPAAFYDEKRVGGGSVDFFDKDNFVYFRPDTPEDIKQRVVKDLKEYYAQKREKGYY